MNNKELIKRLQSLANHPAIGFEDGMDINQAAILIGFYEKKIHALEERINKLSIPRAA